jgi:hypothetical protein
VRYYACESMYNIAKVAKGDILRYFNSVFDGMCKVREKRNEFIVCVTLHHTMAHSLIACSRY